METIQLNSDVFTQILAFINSEKLLATGGIIILMAIIFAETGLFFGFFLPGDSLLFTAGLLTATGVIESHIVLVVSLVSLAAIAGDFTGYWFGKKTGPALFKRPDSFLFKKKYLAAARAFFSKYGGHTIIFGRFFPIIRTFAPIVAGTIKMPMKKFAFFNISGGIIWVHLMILSGYFLAQVFPEIHHYLELIIIGLGIITILPFAKAYITRKNKSAAIKIQK